MFNLLKRKSLKKVIHRPISNDREEASDKSASSPVNNALTSQFLKETAALRGQIEVARRMSPDQEEQLNAIAESLGIVPDLDGNYAKYRELWAAEHGEQVYLDLVDASMPLRVDEQCCFCEPAVWTRLKHGQSLYSVFRTPIPYEKERPTGLADCPITTNLYKNSQKLPLEI